MRFAKTNRMQAGRPARIHQETLKRKKMEIEELEKISFCHAGHVSYDDEHCTTYTSSDGRFGFCDHVPFKDGHPHGRSYRHWRIDGKVYKSLKKFKEALKEVEA